MLTDISFRIRRISVRAVRLISVTLHNKIYMYLCYEIKGEMKQEILKNVS
jgi:hypothetical protein